MAPHRNSDPEYFGENSMKMLSAIRLAVTATVVGMLPTLVHGQILSAKRGFADTGANYNDLQATGAGWYYTWGAGPANPGNFDAKFYPMFWNAPSQTTINNVKATNPDYILGFNEPERSDQANMTVAQAISSWTQISNSFAGTSVKLVSPAVADTGGSSGGQTWLANFMSQARAANLKIDAVAFHWYDVSTPTNPAGAASQFLSRVDSYHNSYGLPVFITEFAIHDWSGTYPVSQMIDANRQFLNIVIPGIESRSYVAGYSWYNWFDDSALYTGNPMTPTSMGYSYIGAVSSGDTADISGMNLGEHVAYLTGGTLTMTTSAATLKYINALANSSTISGTLDWGLNSSSNWVRIQPGATLSKAGSNQITFGAGTATNDGVLQVAQGELRLGVGLSGIGSIDISSTGDSIGSTARLELSGNISVPEPITFAQRNDPAGSDGLRNVSGNNTLGGRMTITVGGNQARVQSDAGQLSLSGAITTDATTARNLYLQGAGNGIVSGVISDNVSNAGGKINLFKAGAGAWTIMAPNTYTGTTTINGGVLRLGQLSATTIANSAIANYSFDNVSGSTVVNSGTGGAAMNGTLTNGATVVSGGRFGNAVSLANGASVNINNPITDLGNTANWTVSAWVKTSTPGASIFTKGNGTNWSYGNTIFYLGGGAGPGSGGIPGAVRWGGGFFQGSTSATAVDDNAWHQVTYVNSGGNYGIYVDGVAQSLSSYNSGFTAGDIGSVVRLGVSTDTVASDGAVNYNGLLDSVQFYNQALSAPQVAALFSGGSAGFLPSTTDVMIASGATLDINGTVQQIASLSGPAGSAVTLGTGQLIVNSATSTQFAGTISGNGGSLVKQGTGTLTLSGANTYNGPIIVSGGTLLLNVTSGSLTIASGVTATVASGATLELAGSISALGTTGGNRAHIVNNSLGAAGQPAGLVVSGMNQVVGGIDGLGSTQVNAGSDLTADHIVQSALAIGGTAGDLGLVTIDASDSSGNPLGQSSGFALANSLTPGGPYGADGISSAALSSCGTDSAALSLPDSAAGGNPSPVPEPSALLLVLLAVTGLAGHGIALRRRARRRDY
jgi:autotransporter-associated beta strand protein